MGLGGCVAWGGREVSWHLSLVISATLWLSFIERCQTDWQIHTVSPFCDLWDLQKLNQAKNRYCTPRFDRQGWLYTSPILPFPIITYSWVLIHSWPVFPKLPAVWYGTGINFSPRVQKHVCPLYTCGQYTTWDSHRCISITYTISVIITWIFENWLISTLCTQGTFV